MIRSHSMISRRFPGHAWIFASAAVSSASPVVYAPCTDVVVTRRAGRVERQSSSFFYKNSRTIIRPLSATPRGGGDGFIEGDAVGLLQIAASVSNKHKLQHYLQNVVRIYAESDQDRRRVVLDYLALQCGTLNHDEILASALRYQNELALDATSMSAQSSSPKATQAAIQLRKNCTPAYELLLQRILIHAKEPTSFFIQLRLDLQQYTRSLSEANEDDECKLKLFYLQRLHHHLVQQLLPTQYSKSHLEIRRITLDESTSVLSYMAEHEAVHPVSSLEEFVRQRLGPQKRVFALFHRLTSQTPLAVLHASLQPTIPASMKEIHTDGPKTVATFYSISNIQPGLEGIGLGERLIRAAVRRMLQERDTNIRIFVTLSPIPRFREWLEQKVDTETDTDVLSNCLVPSDVRYLCDIWQCDPDQVLSRLIHALQAQEEPEQLELDGEPLTAIFHRSLARLAAHYLVHEKQKASSNTINKRKPLNTVARFHVHNGAQVYRINAAADLSSTGWESSFGVMVNYRYDLDALQHNQERYEADFSLAIHENVSNLLPKIELQ